MGAGEANRVPADLGNPIGVREPPHLAREPAEAVGRSFLAALEQHLEPDADPEEREPVVQHPGP